MHNPNLSESEKLEQVKRRAEVMEKKAMRDEMLIRAGNGGDQVE